MVGLIAAWQNKPLRCLSPCPCPCPALALPQLFVKIKQARQGTARQGERQRTAESKKPLGLHQRP